MGEIKAVVEQPVQGRTGSWYVNVEGTPDELRAGDVIGDLQAGALRVTTVFTADDQVTAAVQGLDADGQTAGTGTIDYGATHKLRWGKSFGTNESAARLFIEMSQRPDGLVKVLRRTVVAGDRLWHDRSLVKVVYVELVHTAGAIKVQLFSRRGVSGLEFASSGYYTDWVEVVRGEDHR